MEENESTESVYKAELTDCRSLEIKAEKREATSQRGNLEDLQAGKCYVKHLSLIVSPIAFIL